MKRKKLFTAMVLFSILVIPAALLAMPTVFPHGTTIYQPDKCWNGYTILPTKGSQTVLIDMNGNVVKHWGNVSNEEHPVKLLKGGYVMGATGKPGRIMGDDYSNDMSVVDWDGNIIWSYKKAGMHHDFREKGTLSVTTCRAWMPTQREGRP